MVGRWRMVREQNGNYIGNELQQIMQTVFFKNACKIRLYDIIYNLSQTGKTEVLEIQQ